MDEADGDLLDVPPIELDLTPAVCGVRLDKVLSTLVPQYSRSRLQQWIDAGHVSVDGEIARAKMTVYGDEKVVIYPQPAPEDEAFKPEAMDLNIAYEDAAILVIDKPAGLVVHPAAGNWSGTLLNGLLHYLPAIAGVPRAGIVHRLDKDTSGLMVVAKTLVAHTDLVRQLQARTVKREYLALVWGTPNVSGKVDTSIGRHSRDRVKMAVSENLTAKPALTHFQRLATGMLDGRPVSLMMCQLETGRTHQIRVHMQSIGFALVGDALYGKQHLTTVFPRQALHARRLGLVHPVSGAAVEWSSELPQDFADLIARSGIKAY
ncbi:Ribosomal large subunit pseudouridine synthase D (rRNA-uridine isomerase D) (rRNA pseudouridylate synthase D) [Herminiimonas arsenicoxydans]|uniref:Pseudouridine synthase n=1 Tax=Herminiimonas arsenicoxydans TaxID=204773 RepID=A4G6D9_HERAR|nr:Ribosomal large subunit pseudouridine synthase D (rRNA-uridine isomerase D) (rRNA pseudouridylate synthase D) [Herminiimonas arsenicoxydans]